MAVVWPKLSDFLPAIADLVALSAATTAVACGLQYDEWKLEGSQEWN